MSTATAATASLFAQLASISSSYSAQAVALANAAQSELNNITSYTPTFPTFPDVARPSPDTERAPQPPELGEIPEYEYPVDPPLQNLPRVSVPVAARPVRPADDPFPDRAWAADVLRERYSQLPLPPPPTEPTSVPDFSSLGEEPIPPPNPRAPKSFSVQPLSGTPPELPEPPVFPVFDEDFFTHYHEALAPLGAPLQKFDAWLHGVLTQVKGSDDLLFNEINKVLGELAWSVPEGDWYAATDRVTASAAQQDRHAALREWGAASGLTTGLPFGAKIDVAVEILLGDLRRRYDELQKIDSALLEQEWELLAQAMKTAEIFVRAAVGLSVQELEWARQIEGLARDGAQGAIEATLRVIDIREREVALHIRYYDLQIRRYEALLERETSKLSAVQIALESEALKLTHNRNLLQAHRVAAAVVAQRVDNYQLAINYALVLQNLERVDLERLQADVRQYEANVALFNLTQRRDSAKGQEEKLFLDAEIARQAVYLSELRAFVAMNEIGQANLLRNAQEMQNIAHLYNERVSGLVQQLEAIDKVNEVAIRAIVAGVEAEGVEVELKVIDQEIEDEKEIRDRIAEIEDEKLKEVYELRKHQLNVEKAKSAGEISAQTASVAASLATQAYAGVNGLAIDILTEINA